MKVSWENGREKERREGGRNVSRTEHLNKCDGDEKQVMGTGERMHTSV